MLAQTRFDLGSLLNTVPFQGTAINPQSGFLKRRKI